MSANSALGGFASLLNGKHTVLGDQVDGPQDATIIDVDVAHQQATVVMSESSFSSGAKFGPLPYGRCNPTYGPQVGDTCLVVFVGKGVDRGRILSWWPPA